MRGISAFAAATCILSLGGCSLIFDYGDGFQAGNGGSGGQGGGGGGGGGEQGATGVCKGDQAGACYEWAPETKGQGICTAGLWICDETGMRVSCEGDVRPTIELRNNQQQESCGLVADAHPASWSRRFGDADLAQQANGVAIDPQTGNIIFAGSYRGTFDIGGGSTIAAPPDPNLKEAFVAAVDSSGNGQWIVPVQVPPAEGQQERGLRGVTTNQAGGIFVTGYYNAKPAGQSGGITNALVASISPTGAIQWGGKPRVLGDGNGFAQGTAVAASNDNVFVIGRVYGKGTLTCNGMTVNYDTPDASQDNGGMFIARYTTTTGECASLVLVSGEKVHGTAVVVDADGNAFVTGYFVGVLNGVPGGPLLTKGVSAALFILRITAGGAIDWVKHFSSDGAGIKATAIALDGQGNLLVTGSVSGEGELAGVPFETVGEDMFVLGMAPDGSNAWSKTFGGQGGQTGTSIAANAKGILVAGTFTDNIDVDPASAHDNLSIGGGNPILVQLDAAGSPVWLDRFGSGESPALQSLYLAVSPSVVVLAGSATRTVDFNGPEDALLPKNANPDTEKLDMFVASFPP